MNFVRKKPVDVKIVNFPPVPGQVDVNNFPPQPIQVEVNNFPPTPAATPSKRRWPRADIIALIALLVSVYFGYMTYRLSDAALVTARHTDKFGASDSTLHDDIDTIAHANILLRGEVKLLKTLVIDDDRLVVNSNFDRTDKILREAALYIYDSTVFFDSTRSMLDKLSNAANARNQVKDLGNFWQSISEIKNSWISIVAKQNEYFLKAPFANKWYSDFRNDLEHFRVFTMMGHSSPSMNLTLIYAYLQYTYIIWSGGITEKKYSEWTEHVKKTWPDIRQKRMQ